MPWTGATLLLVTMMESAAENYSFIESLQSAGAVVGYCWHPLILGGVFLFSAIGRKFETQEK